jgi:hypothetical protein
MDASAAGSRAFGRRLDAAFAALLLLSLCACGSKSPSSPEPSPSPPEPSPPPEADIVLGAPYAVSAEFKYIHPGYSASAGAPWGFVHQGLDLIAAGARGRLIAPASGTVEQVEIYQNEHNGKWQVNLSVRHSARFVYHVLFEPGATSRDRVQQQRDAVPLSPGQPVTPGQALGDVLDLSDGHDDPTAHVDLWKGDQNICPEPYFTSAARAGLLALLRAKHPGALLCYP